MKETYSPFKIWRIYQSVNLHYKTDYNIVKYGLAPNFNHETYQKAPSKSAYEKLYAKFPNEDGLICFLGSVFYEYSPTHVNEVTDSLDELREMHLRYKKIMNAPEYHVPRDFKRLLEVNTFQSLVNDPLLVYKATKTETIAIESLILCELSFKMISLLKWSEANPLHKMVRNRMHKYEAFVRLQSGEQLVCIRKVCKEAIQESLR